MILQICPHSRAGIFLFVSSEEGTDFYAADGAVVGADAAPRTLFSVYFGKIAVYGYCVLRAELFALFAGDTAADTFLADGRAFLFV